ncbi:contractile injection system protein, VgrG/Pvc8 family [Lacrimispora sp.]|uniref:contractile injection system protein, VgrG/Pvc8 family n=1 Tax=Lacrimispora sp. TaxID=2719234 RepID=UPI0028A983C2|nr:contractile injection system protein, VgrG/Pvc8 family [Lacrimispora sp.]
MDYEYKGLEVTIELELLHIYDLCILKEINQHASLTLRGICEESNHQKTILQTDENKKIVVKDQNKCLIFCGLITKLHMEEKGEVGTFLLNAASFSYQMDLTKRRRIFQNLEMTYQEVLETVLKAYPNASVTDRLSGNLKIPHFLIQYEETDWEFMKRLASHFKEGIYPNLSSEEIQISFGSPFGESIRNMDGKQEKRALDLIKKQETIWTNSYKKYEVGETIMNQNKKYYVKSVHFVTEKEEILYELELVCNRKSEFPYIPNHQIAHTRMWAEVLEVQRNQLKLHFPMEEISGALMPYFTFEAGENNKLGYYMSDPGAKAEVYFPDEEEQNGFVMSVIRRDQKETSGLPIRVQSIGNEMGNGFQMNEKNVLFSTTGEKTTIRLTSDGVLQIVSSGSMKLSASKDIILEKGFDHLQIKAGKGIQMKAGTTGNNAIEMDESGNIECRCMGNVIYRKTGESSEDKFEEEKGKGNVAGVRDVVIALAGTAFISQAVTGKQDYAGAGKIMDHFTGTNVTVEGPVDSEEQNPIKAGLFHNDDRLFNSFSYGENRNGTKGR